VQPLSWRKRLSLAVGRRSDACLQNGRSRFECCRRALTGPPCPRSRAGALRDRRRLHPQRLTEWFGRHRKAAGVTTGTLHILRHTHATLALTNGVPLHVVAARLGDRPETILRAYAHLLPHSDVEAAEQVAALLA
jgi:integrase